MHGGSSTDCVETDRTAPVGVERLRAYRAERQAAMASPAESVRLSLGDTQVCFRIIGHLETMHD